MLSGRARGFDLLRTEFLYNATQNGNAESSVDARIASKFQNRVQASPIYLSQIVCPGTLLLTNSVVGTVDWAARLTSFITTKPVCAQKRGWETVVCQTTASREGFRLASLIWLIHGFDWHWGYYFQCDLVVSISACLGVGTIFVHGS